MKGFWCMLVMLILLEGCAATKTSRNYSVGIPKRAHYGETVAQWSKIRHSLGRYGYVYKLIYAGLKDGHVLFTYREFFVDGSDSDMRPGISEDLHHDLAAGRVFSAQGFDVQIDSVDANWLSYTIINGPIE